MKTFENNITFVIVSFKSDHIIERCIKSINPNIKIIIVENSGNFHTKNYLENKFLNVEVIIAKKNLGYGAPIKQGVSMARGKYMFIQFSDTEYDHRVSLKMFRISEKYNADAVFGSRLKNMSFKQKLIAIKNKPAFLATILITKMYNIFYKKNFTDVIGSKFYRLDIFKKINLKENNIDWDFELKNRES